MADLFDELNRMTDDELRLQNALFENVTLTNVVKESGHRVVGGLKDFANAFAGAFKGLSQFEYEVKKMSDMVIDASLDLKYKTREELMTQLKSNIVKLAAELSGNEIEDEIEDERLSKIVIDEAAKTFSIEKYKTIANKIDEIIIEYNNAFLKTLHNQLVKESPEEKAITDKLIQNRMNEVSIEAKRQLQQKVMPKEFNGRGIARILRMERETKYLREVLTYLGRQALNTTSAECWTIIMAMKGLKRPSRMQLARFVWYVGSKHGRKYEVSQDLLPGYIAADKQETFYSEEKEFRRMLQQRDALFKNLEQSNQYVEKQRAQQEKERQRMEEGMQQYDELEVKFTDLESKKDDYYEGRKSENENKAYYADVNETKRNLDHAEAEYERLKKRLHEQAKKTQDAIKENESIDRECKNIEAVLSKSIEQRVKQLELLWRAYYFKFQFDKNVFEYVVVNLLREEQLNVEAKLKELHDAKKSENFYDDKIDDVNIFFCNVSQSKNLLIEMSGKKVEKIAKKES